MKRASLALCAAVVLGSLALSPAAEAAVRFEGNWPQAQGKVSLSLSNGERSKALEALASKAKWNLVVRGEVEDSEPLTLHVDSANPRDLLEAILSDGAWVAERKGDIVTIWQESHAAAPPALPAPPPAPPAPPRAVPLPPDLDDQIEAAIDAIDSAEVPHRRQDGEVNASKGPGGKKDLTILANSMRIKKDDVVRNVTVLGGIVEIEGRVTGNLVLYGGAAHLFPTAQIDGDASVTAGAMTIDQGAHIGGDLDIVGGRIDGAENANVDGSVTLDPSDGENKASMAARAGHAVSSGLRMAAFLFVLGVLFIALGENKADELRVAIADKPMRSIALGIVGLLGTLATLVLCALTIIGIPVAVVGLIVAVALGFAGTVSSLTVLGATVSGHKSKNVYVHLAVGCAMFMVAGFLPWIGHLLQTAVVFAGLGAVVTTRGLGLLRRKPKIDPQTPPYR